MDDAACCQIPECSIAVQTPYDDCVCCFDSCIYPEVRHLWEMGVRTLCSCCGHGQDDKAYIRVSDYDADLMIAIGYEPYEPHECLFHKESVSFRAKTVAREREHNRPVEGGDVTAIRALWKETSSGRRMTSYV